MQMRKLVTLLGKCRRNLGDCASANAWWCTLKGRVFGAGSDVPPLCSPGGVLISDPAGKAELLSAWFDFKQSETLLSCGCLVILEGILQSSMAFRARKVERHLLDLDPNGGVDQSGCFPMVFRKTASVFASTVSRLFHRLLRCGKYPLEWRIADVIPKVPYQRFSATIGRFRLPV